MTGRGGERGFILVIVLWTIALLALAGTFVTRAAHDALAEAAAIRDAAGVEAVADGIIREAIFRLLDPANPRIAADGAVRPVAIDGGRATVAVEDAAGRINPNFASTALLTLLLREVGDEPATAPRIAAAIADWHARNAVVRPLPASGVPWGPPRDRFQTMGELLLVAGMTPDLLSRLSPFLSVYTDGPVDPAKASPLVAKLLEAAPPGPQIRPPGRKPGRVMDITATVVMPGARTTRHAVVRFDNVAPDAQHPWQVLAWD
jgi:general secretion pathway protein K